jgi:hypothetical protein
MTEALQGSLAQMSGGDARKLASAIRKADSGELLNEREIGLLRQNRIAGYDEQIARSQQSIINRDENKQFIQRNQAEKTQVNELVANVKVQSEAVLKLQAEVDAKAQSGLARL